MQSFTSFNTSSTTHEISTVLDSLQYINKNYYGTNDITIYTDCDSLICIADRKSILEENNFITKKGKLIKNRSLYKLIFKNIDRNNITFTKIKGHIRQKNMLSIEECIFNCIDIACRKEARELYKKNLIL